MRPDLTRVPAFYHGYIKHVTLDEILPAMKKNTAEMLQLFHTIPTGKQNYRYAEGKWTIKELMLHLIDAERIFSYRALRFARKDTTPLPGFEEDDYVKNAKTHNRQWEDLIEEFKAVRRSTEMLFASFDEDQLEATGTSNNNLIYVRAIGFIIPGHCSHHKRVIEERYL